MLENNYLLETDPTKKNADWANNLITHFRSYWQPLVDRDSAKRNMDVILSRTNMENVLKMFKDPKRLGMEFIPIAVMEKIRNILVGEAYKAGLSANINALDPVAEEQRKKDKKLLDNKNEIEELITHLQQQIGLPEYKIKNEKSLGKKNPFHGNLEMFDELGLDSDDPEDKGYFMQAWHRLQHEMDAQEIVNAYMKANELEDSIEDWMNDALASKAVCKQAFVNEITGAIDIKYLPPSNLMLIPGKRKDGKDAMCVGYEVPSTIGEIIKMIGNSFNLADEWRYLLSAINYTNGTSYTGIWDGSNVMYGKGDGDKTLCSIDRFASFKIQIGYIEWKSYDQTVFKMGVDFHGNLRRYPRGVDYNPEDSTGYAKESWYNQFTYKSFYVTSGSNTQRIYKFGKLFHQVIEGAEDEYSSYSISFRKVTGPTVAEIARPYIELVQEAFQKYRWMVRRAKPKGRSYNYESLVQIAKHMINQGSTKDQVHAVISMFEEGINEIFTIPKIDGQRVGGGIVPNGDLPNGLDPTAISFQGIIDWAVDKIKQDLGINDIREAYSPKTNDVYKLQQATLESSRNATAYIPWMLDGLMRDTAKHILAQAQDIVAYKESMAYAYLKNLVGYGPIQSLEQLENIALHRYGVFVNSFNTYIERQKVLQDAEVAFNNQEISYETKLLINAIDDFRKAAYILAFEKQRAKKLAAKEQELAHQRAMELEKYKHGSKMEEINAAGLWAWKKEDRKGYYLLAANADDNKTKVDVSIQKGEQRRTEIIDKTDESIRKKAEDLNMERQAPLV